MPYHDLVLTLITLFNDTTYSGRMCRVCCFGENFVLLKKTINFVQLKSN